MAGFSDKIKKITSVLSKKDKKKGADSPFDSDAPSFLQGTPDLGSIPDLSAGLPPAPPGVQNTPGISGNPPFPPGMAPPGAMAQQVPQQSSVNDELVEENRKKIKDVESKISKSDVTLNIVQRENEDIKKTVDKIDQSVLELLSLYEIVSNQVNPFVGDDVATRATIERFEKTENRITEMGDMLVQMKNDFEIASQKMNMPQGVSPEADSRMQNLESKMDAFADAMIMMHEGIEKLSSSTEELFSRTGVLDQNIVDLAETTANISFRLETLENKPSSSNDRIIVENAPYIDDEDGNVAENEVAVVSNKVSIPVVRLESIKGDPTSVVVLLNWIEFLMERVGRNNLMDALDYYMDIGWISEGVMSEIMAYARGIDYYVEKPTWRLLPEDHTKSLLFIERLSGRKIDRNMLSSIDREMAKVKHGLEELYGI